MVNFVYGNATTDNVHCNVLYTVHKVGMLWTLLSTFRREPFGRTLAESGRFVVTKHHTTSTTSQTSNPERRKMHLECKKAVEKYQNRFIWIWNFKIFIPKLKLLNFTASSDSAGFPVGFQSVSKVFNTVARWKNQQIFIDDLLMGKNNAIYRSVEFNLDAERNPREMNSLLLNGVFGECHFADPESRSSIRRLPTINWKRFNL